MSRISFKVMAPTEYELVEIAKATFIDGYPKMTGKPLPDDYDMTIEPKDLGGDLWVGRVAITIPPAEVA